MNQSRSPLLALLAAVIALAGLAVWWWSRAGGPGGAVAPVVELAAPGESRPASAVERPQASAEGRSDERSLLEAAAAGSGSGADGRWITGSVRWDPRTPADERVEVVAVVVAEDQAVASMLRPGALDAARLGFESEPGRVSRALCDAEGGFRLAVAGSARNVVLDLDARYSYLARPVAVPPGEDTIALDAELGGCIVGRIVLPSIELDPADRALVQGATVQVTGWKMGGGTMRTKSASSGLDSELDFELGGLPSDLRYSLTCDPQIFVPARELELKVEPGRTTEKDIALEVGATIRGRCVDSDGAPLAGVNVAPIAQFRRGYWGATLQRRTQSASDGVWNLRGLRPGKLTLEATLEGFVPARSAELAVADRALLTDVELRLARGNSIRGRVVFAGGAPAVGARVRVEEPLPGGANGTWAGQLGHDATANASGEFAVTGLGTQACSVTATAQAPGEGAQTASEAEALLAGSLWRARAATVEPGSEIVLILSAPHAVGGRVVDDLGAAVPAFTLSAQEILSGARGRPGAPQRLTHGYSAADGRFELHLSAGEWSLTASAAGHGPSPEQTVRFPGEVTALELVVPRAGRVEGKVVDPTGAPTRAGRVAVLRSADGDRRQRSFDDGRNEPVACDENGAFVLEDLTPGAIALQASADDLAPSERTPCVVLPGETTAGLVLALRVGGRITGEIYANGGPDAGRSIMAQNLGHMSSAGSQSESDAQGRFELVRLEPGKYQVIAMPRADMLRERMDVEADPAALIASFKAVPAEVLDGETTHVVLGAPPSAPVRVHGRVSSGGRPFAKGIVIAVAEGESMLAAMKADQTDDDGAYELVLDHAGGYTFLVAQGLGDAQNCEFNETVPEVEEHALDFALPLGRIAGRVLGPDGEPFANAQVNLESEHGFSLMNFGSGRNSTSREDGSFVFDWLRPSTYTLRAYADPRSGGSQRLGVAVRAQVAVTADRAVEGIELRLPEAGSVTGAVRGADGQPLEGAAIFVRDAEGRLLSSVSRVQSDAAGRFRYEGVPAGSVTVAARGASSASVEVGPLEVRAGETTEVELRLSAATLLNVTVEGEDAELVRARISVLDERGREVGSMFGGNAMERLFADGFSSTAFKLGPFPPGKYKVTATTDDGQNATKMVTLSGQEERSLTIRLKE